MNTDSMHKKGFVNSYADEMRALAYSGLEFEGTYYLAYRDLPCLIRKYASGNKALDFGCGAGRSTRFLGSLGFETLGVDISAEMLALARQKDPEGSYLHTGDDELSPLQNECFDLILSAFTFDNVPTVSRKLKFFNEFMRVLKPGGCFVNLVSSPELYTHDWVSFRTTCFPGNFTAGPGDKVHTIITDTEDPRPVDDELCPEHVYRYLFSEAGFRLLEMHRPLALPAEPWPWINETRIAPWTVFIVGKNIVPEPVYRGLK